MKFKDLKENIKKVLKEAFEDEFDFLKGNPNPFIIGNPLVVVWLDRSATKEQIGELWEMIKEYTSDFDAGKEKFINSIFKNINTKGSAYVKIYIDKKDNKRASYGDSKWLFNYYQYSGVSEDLLNEPYVEYKLKDIFKS